MVIATIKSLIEHDCFYQKLLFDEYNHSPAKKHEYFSNKLSAELDSTIAKFYPHMSQVINEIEDENARKEILFSLKEFVFFSNYCLEKESFPLYVVEICSRHYSKLICNGVLFGLTHKNIILYNQNDVEPEPFSFSMTDMLDFYKQSYLLNLRTNNAISHVVAAIEEHTRLLVFYELAKDNMTTEHLPETDLRLYQGEHRCAFCLHIYKDSNDGNITRRHKNKFKKTKFNEVNEVLDLSIYCLGSGRKNTESGLDVIEEAILNYSNQITLLKSILDGASNEKINLQKECISQIKKLNKLIEELDQHKCYNFSA